MSANKMEIISSYTAQQAVEDGILVPLDRRNFITRTALACFDRSLPAGAKPPNCWPVDMMGWFRAKDQESKAMAAAGGIVGSHGRSAATSGRVHLFAIYADAHTFGELATAPPADGTAFERLILAENECGGVTLMLPEDD